MDYDTRIHTDPDARAWARFFMETKAKHPGIADDEETMHAWFANAMMAMYDHVMLRVVEQRPRPLSLKDRSEGPTA